MTYGTSIVLSGCVGEKGVAPSLRQTTTTLGTVLVSPTNAVMAIGDTMTLDLTGRSVAGNAIAGFDSVEYILQNVTDSLRVRISPVGLVTALSTSGTNNPVLVEVIGFKDGVASADQAVIQVVTTSFSGATLSIHPIPPDSAKLEYNDYKTIVPVIQNSSGQSVANPTLRFDLGPGDSSKLGCYVPTFVATATLTPAQLSHSACQRIGGGPLYGQVSLNQIYATATLGTAWIHANVRVFGSTLHDSVQYTMTNDYTGAVIVAPVYLLGSVPTRNAVVIAPGGTVTFYNQFPAVINAQVSWTLNDSTAATVAMPASTFGGTSGNITAITSSQTATRRFLNPGVYTWTSVVSGGIPPYTGQIGSGQIIVQ